MKKLSLKLLFFLVLAIGVFGTNSYAHAATPSLTVFATGTGNNNVQINVTGDSNHSVILYYQRVGSGLQSQHLGLTSTTGFFSQTVNSSTVNAVNGSSVYVTVNNQNSQSVIWPVGSGISTGTISLNITNANMNVGQTTRIIASNLSGNSVFVSNNSNSSVASTFVDNNEVTINANNTGTTLITICDSSNSSGCATVLVTVGSGGSTSNSGNFSVDNNNITVAVGKSVVMNIQNGFSPYTLSSTNNFAFRPVVGENRFSVIGLSLGSGTVTLCSSGGRGCINISVNVNNVGSNNSSSIFLGQSSVTLNTGNSVNVSISGQGGYYISNNTNSNVISASINGNNVNVHGRNSGSGTVTVCQSSGQCVNLFVSVQSGTTNTTTSINRVSLSPASVTLSTGNSTTVNVLGGTDSSYYIAYNSNGSAISANVTGSSLRITGNSAVAGVLVICSSASSCSGIAVNINSSTVSSGNWVYCSAENGFCSFSGTKQIRYGASGVYTYRTVTGGTTCSNANLGDPIFGVVKSCWYSN